MVNLQEKSLKWLKKAIKQIHLVICVFQYPYFWDEDVDFKKFRNDVLYKKSKHPALVVGEQVSDDNTEEYRYRKVMHGEKDGKRTNEKVYPNPDPRDPDPMYIGKRIRHDDKENFEPKPLPWKYPKKDKKK